MTGSKLHQKTSSALNHIYDFTTDIAERNEGKGGVAAGTAATILSMGIDKFNRISSTKDDIEELSKLEEIDEIASNHDEKPDHFIDRLLEKLLIHNIPADSIERLNIESKLKDTDRTQKPRLSIVVLTSNFKKLSARMSGLFQIQYGLIKVLTWKKPTVTLTYMILYTSVCLYPHLVLIYPLIFVLFVIMVPAYEYRHPIEKADIIRVKKRGQSLLDFFNDSHWKDASIVNDFVKNSNFLDDSVLTPMSSGSDNNLTTIDSATTNISAPPSASTSRPVSKPSITKPIEHEEYDEEEDGAPERRNTKVAKSKIELLINMRDLQNLTTDVIKLYDVSETFWYETAGFKDERTSTSLFFSVLLSVAFLLMFGSYTPWRSIFIFGGWLLIGICHPSSSKYIKDMHKNLIEPREKEMAKKMQKIEREDILLDELPQVSEVEIFELEQRGLTSTKWEPFSFTTTLFEKNNSIRISQRTPTGVNDIKQVLPPAGWSFEVDSNDSWSIDYIVQKYIDDRGLSNLVVDENNEWVYDESHANSSPELEFRRRRWFRNCFRYSRPAKKPSSARG